MPAQQSSNDIELLDDPEELDLAAQQLEFESFSHYEEIPPNPLLESSIEEGEELQICEKIGQELLLGEMEPQCWAKALQEAGGDEQKAKYFYSNWRSEVIHDQVLEMERKTRAFETRRMKCFRAVVTKPQPACVDPYQGAGFWEAMIAFSCMGIVLTIGGYTMVFGDTVGLMISFVITSALVLGLRKWYSKSSIDSMEMSYVKLTASVATMLVLVSLVFVFVGSSLSRFMDLRV